MDSLKILTYIYTFIIGTCIASFINVVIERLPKKEGFISGRSHCNDCQRILKWYDLVPVISFIVLKGKCRYCQKAISKRGWIIEIFGGLIGMFCFYQYGFALQSVVVFMMTMILLAISMIDLDTMTIPDGLNIALFFVSFILMILNQQEIVESLLGMFCISLGMIALNIMITESFGGGDIKLMSAAGIGLGWKKSLLATLIAIILAGSYSVYLLIQKKVDKKSYLAFGPYLSIGIFIAFVYGQEIINWYLNLMV